MYVDICIFFGFSVCFRWLPSSIFLISVLCRSAPLENYSPRTPSPSSAPISFPHPSKVWQGYVPLDLSLAR